MNTFVVARARAKQTRLDYFRWRFKRLLGLTNTLEKPWVAGMADELDGTLKKETLAQDLEVHVPKWLNFPTNPAFWETLQLKFSLTGAPNTYTAAGDLLTVVPKNPPDPDQFPIKMPFPKELLPRDGDLWIVYEHENYRGEKADSAPIKLICDSTPPYGEQEPRFAEGPSDTIDEAYLQTHPDGIEFVIPDYAGRQASDYYKLYYRTEPPSGPGDLTITANEGALQDSRRVIIPVEIVRSRGDGTFYSVFTVSDKAGNTSRISYTWQVNVKLTEEETVPENLQPPLVRLAADGVLDLADAQLGIKVEIDEYTNHDPEDRLVVSFRGIPLPEIVLGETPFPIEVDVGNGVLQTAYGNATEYLTVPVSYEVRRGTASFGSPKTDVILNFSVAGPARPDPDLTWPSSTNPNLTAPTITSASGPPNEVGTGDYGKDVTVTFGLYAGIKPGQVIDIFWGGTEVPEAQYVHTGGSADIERVIPWLYVSRGGTGVVQVHYTARGREASAFNDQESVRQPVNVPTFILEADPVVFQNLTPRGWLSCSSLWDPDDPAAPPSFRVKVPPFAQFDLGVGQATIFISWMVFTDDEMNVPITEVRFDDAVDVTRDMIDNGFIWRIEPYADYILPIYDQAPEVGYARVIYSIQPANGAPIPSAKAHCYVSIAGAATETCDISRP
ncbi:hypothetical protein [Pseudomonas sp. NPDC089406]|uniref:hypothetical protein n=1 Tax=Pseudomonas sp. NPDC089406 TaxID=3364463 RepID=UPI00384B2D2F